MKFLSLIFVSILASSSVSFADVDFAILAGLRSSSADTDLNNATVSAKSSFQAGALFNIELTKAWHWRTGILLVGRQVSVSPTLQGKVDLNFTYVDVPLTALYKFNSAAGIFFGPVVAFNQGKETTCSASPTCSPRNVDAAIFPWQVGVSFRFAPQVGGELYYEYLPGAIEKNISNVKTVGANLLIYFE